MNGALCYVTLCYLGKLLIQDERKLQDLILQKWLCKLNKKKKKRKKKREREREREREDQSGWGFAVKQIVTTIHEYSIAHRV